MPKRIPAHIVQFQAEGAKAERIIVQGETRKESQKLAGEMPTFPPERLIYVRNLVSKVLRKELDLEVFKLFVRMTNSYTELETCMPRAKMLVRERRR